MNALYTLTKRHIRLYFRDRSALFFSLLSVLIVLLLMLVFLGDMNKQELMQLIQQAGGTIKEADAQHVIIMWTIAGMLVVNAFTVPITMIAIFVQDKENGKMESFYCSRISRWILLSSYLLSAILTGMIMSILLLGISFLYVVCSGYPFLQGTQLVRVVLLLLLCNGVSACLVMLLAQWINSDPAWGAFSTLAGTLIGFLGGIYLPMTMLPSMVASLLKCLPFLHEAALLRDVFTSTALTQAFASLPHVYQTGYQKAMGITVYVNDSLLSPHFQILALLLCGIIALSISVYRLHHRTAFDR